MVVLVAQRYECIKNHWIIHLKTVILWYVNSTSKKEEVEIMCVCVSVKQTRKDTQLNSKRNKVYTFCIA